MLSFFLSFWIREEGEGVQSQDHLTPMIITQTHSLLRKSKTIISSSKPVWEQHQALFLCWFPREKQHKIDSSPLTWWVHGCWRWWWCGSSPWHVPPVLLPRTQSWGTAPPCPPQFQTTGAPHDSTSWHWSPSCRWSSRNSQRGQGATGGNPGQSCQHPLAAIHTRQRKNEDYCFFSSSVFRLELERFLSTLLSNLLPEV